MAKVSGSSTHTVVTGAAGFIGSHLVDRLLAEGHTVIGVDSLTTYYSPHSKRENLVSAQASGSFELVARDLATDRVDDLLEGASLVFHLAGQPGVRASWGAGFDEYTTRNVLATQRLLEACRDQQLQRFVFSSSSSVYGAAERYPTREIDLPAPLSPYGVTKLAAEHLCGLYGKEYGIPTVSLRYFTVYGPRQRPDMAMHRLVECALSGTTFPLNGTGEQVRDFTFVSDAVNANVLASTMHLNPGTVLNVGGGSMTRLSDVIATIEQLTGHSVLLEHLPVATGDPERTGADNTQAGRLLGWHPTTSITDGLTAQVAWHVGRREVPSF